MKSFYCEDLSMKRRFLFVLGLMCLAVSVLFFSCGEVRTDNSFVQADSLNQLAYEIRYKNLVLSEEAANKALQIGEKYPSMKAAALNNLAFCAFMRMDFEQADSLLKEVYRENANELECLVADVGMMKVCQRTAMNKEFYDYRNSALRRMKRISEDETALGDAKILRRFNYVCSEFSITSAIYYYYLQQEPQSLAAIQEIDEDNELAEDTAQLLYYYYMKGSGGLYEANTPEEVVVGEFDYLIDCLSISHEKKYIYFEANALQAMAELLKSRKNYDLLLERRPGMMRAINNTDMPWERYILSLAENALSLFKQYGDWYQISGTYRTLASCYNELGQHTDALLQLEEALSYVNLHHEKFYHCHDTLDRLKPYVPMATESIELRWINAEGIKTVPEWIARFREQLSVTYAALGMKPQSDYNRNIYLDILDYTRQDKELESRFVSLEKESRMLNVMLTLVVGGVVATILLIAFFSKYWRIRYISYVDKLRQTIEICKSITTSIPANAENVEDVIESVMQTSKEKIIRLLGVSDMDIHLFDQEKSIQDEGMVSLLLKNSAGHPMGVWLIKTDTKLRKDDKALMQIIEPYLSWTLENGLNLVSLGDERRYLEKEQYVYEQHLEENKRQNLIKKACLFLITSITPYIDRVVNEVHKLTAFNYLADKEVKESKYKYIDELVTCISEYNDILALWIKMRQGSLKLNIENFELNALFEVIKKSRRNFDLKMQTFLVKPTDVLVKADKALTLFMINTLTENARKYTQRGGEIQVYAHEEKDYVEISVCDNGPGLSSEDVKCILEEKVYDSGMIGVQTALDANELQKNKGSGFGLMNCKGIIEKYRKTNELFKVCCFQIESNLGSGSRFYFRLPKGARRGLGLLIFFMLSSLYSCEQRNMVYPDEAVYSRTDSITNDSLLNEANHFANRVYESNLEGRYSEALFYADSALTCLNNHYLKYSSTVAPMLSLIGEGASAELEWFASRFETDYYALLDVRNESAVAYLALGELDGYRYNNQAYTALYKQISRDSSLEEYCIRMQQSAGNKTVAIILCIALLLAILIGYYLFYLRHRLMYRYGLEQVLEINRHVLDFPIAHQKEIPAFISSLVTELFKDVNELISMDVMGMAVFNDESHDLYYAFSTSFVEEEELKEDMKKCFTTQLLLWEDGRKAKCLPLCVEISGEKRCVGVLALQCAFQRGHEDDRLMLELIAGYIAIVVYNVVEIVAQKYLDIEIAQDENRRIQREDNQLHVQNMVLDNCFSTIKHETIYYPHRIKQIIEKLYSGMSEDEERKQVETIAELIGYYKDIFTILSSCAARQLDEITFRRAPICSSDLIDAVSKYFKRMSKKRVDGLHLKIKTDTLWMIGDFIQLKFLLENLIDEALTYIEGGCLELNIYKEGPFVRFDFIDRRRCYSQEELNQLFYPNLSRMQRQGEEGLRGLEYLVCKQIIREHDEFTGVRGCRMNACQAVDGGFMVWFTIPAK